MTARVLVFPASPQDWQSLLVEPEKPWRRGYSSYAIVRIADFRPSGTTPEAIHQQRTAQVTVIGVFGFLDGISALIRIVKTGGVRNGR